MLMLVLLLELESCHSSQSQIDGGRLLSREKPTAQSDTAWFGYSWRAVDGNSDVFYWNSTCTHTDFFNENVAANAEDWWRVDLLNVYNVTRIEVYTWYGQPLKLDGTVVKVDGVLCEESRITMTDNDTRVEDMKKTLKCNRVGRVVSLENPPNSQADQAVIMNLCEVEVFGFNFSEEDRTPPKDTIKWNLTPDGLLLVSGENFIDGAVCDSWMNMSSTPLDLICRQLHYDRAYSFWTAPVSINQKFNVDHIECKKNSTNIDDCTLVGWKTHTYCLESDALHLKCINSIHNDNASLHWAVKNEGGYIKEKLKKVQKGDGLLYKCPFENEHYEILQKFSCSTAPRFVNDTQEVCYKLTKTCKFSDTQMCGIDGQKAKDGRCMVICPTKLGESIALPFKYICNGEVDCKNGVDEIGCNFDGSVPCTLDFSMMISAKKVQETLCDESYYSCGGGWFYYDENIENCNHTTGRYITHSKPSWIKNWWFHPSFTCSKALQNYWSQEGCKDPGIESARELGPNEGIRCPSTTNASVQTYVPPFNMCTNPRYADGSEDEYHPCLNWEEQMNCQEGGKNEVLTCEVGKKNSTITKYLLCGRGTSCDDEMDENCTNLTTADNKICKVHNHQICDGYDDCDFGIDEAGCWTKIFHEVTCERRVSYNRSERKHHPILKSFVMNKLIDCINGKDESLEYFKQCGKNGTERLRWEASSNKCNEMLKISKITEDTRYLNMDNVCDHVPDFPEEKEMCYISRKYVEVSTRNIHEAAGRVYIPPCLPDLQKYNKNNKSFDCSEKYIEIIGMEGMIVAYPKSKKRCSFLYGETYLFASCNDLCIEDAKCMHQYGNVTECVNTDFDTVNTLMQDRSTGKIEIVKASLKHKPKGPDKSSTIKADVFPCGNGRCIKNEKVCDLVDDCGDGSDEDDCVNQFQCDASKERLVLEKRCNGVVNCVDFSDECGTDCTNVQRRIISSDHLKNTAWVIGTSSTLINILVLIKSGVKLARMREVSVVFRDNFLIMLIAFGDLLVGAYLLLIAIADYYKEDGYCKDQFNWRGGSECFYLGIISSIGSQVSLFTMTVLSLYRVYRIRNLFHSSILSRKRQMLTILVCLLIIVISILISIVPVMTQMEDFFINGLSYEGITLFVGMINKTVHTNVIKQYQGQMRIQYKDGLPTMSWKTIRRFIGDMFSKDHGGVEGKGTGFYGNSGVCLFKYFVTDDDPQRIYSLSILFLNFFCFVVITVSYVLVLIVSRSNSNTRHVAQMNTALQRKISLIILSDACCWIPFIAIGVLHFMRQIDASPLYDFCSIVVLPVNSLINPIIYHSEFNEWLRVTSNFFSSIQRRIRLELRLNAIIERGPNSNNESLPTPVTAETSNPKVVSLSETSNPKVVSLSETSNPKGVSLSETSNPKVVSLSETNNPKVVSSSETNNPKVVSLLRSVSGELDETTASCKAETIPLRTLREQN